MQWVNALSLAARGASFSEEQKAEKSDDLVQAVTPPPTEAAKPPPAPSAEAAKPEPAAPSTEAAKPSSPAPSSGGCPFAAAGGAYATTSSQHEVRVENLETGKVQLLPSQVPPHYGVGCRDGMCHSAMMDKQNGPPEVDDDAGGDPAVVAAEAEAYITQFYAEHGLGDDARDARLAKVRAEIARSGSYRHSYEELQFGARLAWRNSSRCINRIQWKRLEVLDRRHVSEPRAVFEAIKEHLSFAFNGGTIISTMSVFPPKPPGQQGVRIWNSQLYAYAAYPQPDGSVLGDPVNFALTRACEALGWVGARTAFDILPILIQAPGALLPELFTLPKDLLFEVPIHSEEVPASLGLRWPAIPALSRFSLDLGGVIYSCIPFNGWFMGTEVTRDLGDAQRYAVLPAIAQAMGLRQVDSELWLDRAQLELNRAVLSSFARQRTSMVDHHSASNGFMRFMEKEVRTRGYCPGDWVWIVPPVGGSTTKVFHQEMINYTLKPMYRPNVDPIHSFDLMKAFTARRRRSEQTIQDFRSLIAAPQAPRVSSVEEEAGEAADAAVAAAAAPSLRVTIVYGSETGESASAAYRLRKDLATLKLPAAEVVDLEEFDPETLLAGEGDGDAARLLIVVTSTFGDGAPPGNAAAFTSWLAEQTDTGVLSHLMFAVLGRGSRVYENFNACGRGVDAILGALGGQRVVPLGEVDALEGDSVGYLPWKKELLQALQDVLHPSTAASAPTDGSGDGSGGNMTMAAAAAAAAAGGGAATAGEAKDASEPLPPPEEPGLLLTPCSAEEVKAEGERRMAYFHNQFKRAAYGVFTRAQPFVGLTASVTRLASDEQGREAVHVTLDMRGPRFGQNPETAELERAKAIDAYRPGDHLAVLPENSEEAVNDLLSVLGIEDGGAHIRVSERPGSLSHAPRVLAHPCAYREVFGWHLNINDPPSQPALAVFARYAQDADERARLQTLAEDAAEYRRWADAEQPGLADFLRDFPSLLPALPLAVVVEETALLQPRFYSLSSAPEHAVGIGSLTVGVLTYTTPSGRVKRGVCSHYLASLKKRQGVRVYVRPNPRFHVPRQPHVPIIMIAAGTGIAPFRGFWQQEQQRTKLLLFGCRHPDVAYHSQEIAAEVEAGRLQLSMAYSRNTTGPDATPKEYVTDRLAAMSEEVTSLLLEGGAHVYVCGDTNLAAGVERTLKTLLLEAGRERRAAASGGDGSLLQTWQGMVAGGRYSTDLFSLNYGYTVASSQKRQLYLAPSTVNPAETAAAQAAAAAAAGPISGEIKW